MFTLTTPVDPSVIPSDSPPQNQQGGFPPTSTPDYPSTGWKMSSSNNRKSCQQNSLESWKTSSSSSFYATSTAPLTHQYQRQPRPLPHIPTPPSSFDSNQQLPYMYQQQQQQQQFMNESFHYDQNKGNIYQHYNCMPENYTSTPSLHQSYQQYTMDPQSYHNYQQTTDYYGDNYNQYQQSYSIDYQMPPQHPYYEQQQQQQQQQQQHPWQEPSSAYTEWAESTPSSTPSPVLESHQASSSSSPKASTKEKKPLSLSTERNVRQITVKSVNKEHRVWIDILPTETGLSLAAKIHRIATFGTRKILKITTTHGRTIPLDNRPIFGSWMDMTRFENGEHWQVEWGSLDKSMVDKFFAKVIQVGGSSRHYAAQKQQQDSSSRDKKTG